MAILLPALHRVREQGKRAVCLSNLKQLTMSWIMYADDNDDVLVNGAIGYSNATTGWGKHAGEVAWVDRLATGWDEQQDAIRDGALWPFVKDVKMYRCPTGRPGEALTYAIMFSMNSVNHTPTQGVKGAHIKKRTEIHNPAPPYRIVFIDEGWMTPDAFAVNYDNEAVERHRHDKACQTRRAQPPGQLDTRITRGLPGPVQDAEGLLGKIRLYTNSSIALRTCK
jgi:hypothetical protein